MMEDLGEKLNAGRVLTFEAVSHAALALWLARSPHVAPCLVVTADPETAEKVTVDLQSLGLPDVVYLPAQEHTPFEDVAIDTATVFARLALRHRLRLGQAPRVLVTPAYTLGSRWMPDDVFDAHTSTYAVGQDIDRDALLATLVTCGYQPVSFVEDLGTFALRGGIVDVFIPGDDLPIRFDLFGDELASLKRFVPETQRTFDGLEAVTVFPIRDVIYTDATVARAKSWLRHEEENATYPTRRMRQLREEITARHYFYGVEALWPAFYERTAAVMDALIGFYPVIVRDGPSQIDQQVKGFGHKAELDKALALERHHPTVAVSQHLTSREDIAAACGAVACIDNLSVALMNDVLHDHGTQALDDLSAALAAERKNAAAADVMTVLVQFLSRQIDADHQVFFCCSTLGRARQLQELLHGRKRDLPLWEKFPAAYFEKSPRRARTRAANVQAVVVVAPLSGSVALPKEGINLVSDVDIFASAPKALVKKHKRPSKQALSTLQDLQPGDFVIHQEHGIGRYEGLTRLILGGVDGDYLHLVYANDDKLYLPVYRINQLQRYRGPTQAVRLDKLGGTRWLRAKQRVKDAVLGVAHELLALQAQRQARPGFALPAGGESYQAFASAFAFEETPDQARAIVDVLQDLQKDTPMDRLVCGDVGYGKTEVAMRAAYLAVMGGRQVAMLVPTTVLAEQHRETFAERMGPFGVMVEALSRFSTATQAREIIARAKEGKVDIVIGTHRLLSHDVHFKNLGLLVVDEEQRFGVKHKERLKKLRAHVHVLTLSATPIPRTLHMASVGLRDLSLIQTPPLQRQAIRTEILHYDETVMADAIRRELQRGGQVFVVHNRVQTINAMADVLCRLVPEANVVVAHGQMSAESLERIMVDFVHRKHNVLVCTAIIESGIDIPTANTMIVNRADTFGLSQLYQLRGRIGRGRERAHAYLMLPDTEDIGREAMARLALLKRFSALGSGFQIASHDLELRGAGDLLGADQSGNIAAVGFELYTELLAEAVERARGQNAPKVQVEPDIKLPVTAVLPEKYVPDPMQRLALYQRMAQAPSDAAVFDVYAEIGELYGEPPAEVRALAEVMVMRRRLQALGADSLIAAYDNGTLKVSLSFVPEAPIDRQFLVRRCQIDPKRYRLLASGKLAITLEADGHKSEEAEEGQLLAMLRQALGELKCVDAS